MSWAITTEKGKWLVDDFTLDEIDEIAGKHGKQWGDIEFSPGSDVNLLHDLVCAGCEKTGSPKPAMPKTHGDRMRLLAMVEQVTPDLPTMLDIDEDGGARPLDGSPPKSKN